MSLYSGNNIGGTAWNTTQDQQAILMQQMYANYMTQYVQYLQVILFLIIQFFPFHWLGQRLNTKTLIPLLLVFSLIFFGFFDKNAMVILEFILYTVVIT